MTTRRLLFETTDITKLGVSDLLWRRSGAGQSSFRAAVNPDFGIFGGVPLPNMDMATISIAVFLADRTITRPKNWTREITLDIPVYSPETWQNTRQQLEEMLGFLTSDEWSVTFSPRANAGAPIPNTRKYDIELVSLFSGGADSLCGAVRALSDGKHVLFVSHWDWAVHAGVQKRLIRWLARRYPKQVFYRQIEIGRQNQQINGLYKFPNEASRRSRSLLFLGLGTALASVDPKLSLWIPENGYASLNPPLTPERLGSLSTRTTHPVFLTNLQKIMFNAGAGVDIINPFADMTKGEMFSDALSRLGAADAETLLGMSHSCAHTRWAMGTGLSPETQCGICYGCLVRRAAFHAARIKDTTTYLTTALPVVRQPQHLRQVARQEVQAVEYATNKKVNKADILTVGLPAGADVDKAVGLANRGLDELAALITSADDLKSLL